MLYLYSVKLTFVCCRTIFTCLLKQIKKALINWIAPLTVMHSSSSKFNPSHKSRCHTNNNQDTFNSNRAKCSGEITPEEATDMVNSITLELSPTGLPPGRRGLVTSASNTTTTSKIESHNQERFATITIPSISATRPMLKACPTMLQWIRRIILYQVNIRQRHIMQERCTICIPLILPCNQACPTLPSLGEITTRNGLYQERIIINYYFIWKTSVFPVRNCIISSHLDPEFCAYIFVLQKWKEANDSRCNLCAKLSGNHDMIVEYSEVSYCRVHSLYLWNNL